MPIGYDILVGISTATDQIVMNYVLPDMHRIIVITVLNCGIRIMPVIAVSITNCLARPSLRECEGGLEYIKK